MRPFHTIMAVIISAFAFCHEIKAQDFFNLTPDQVRIDDTLPVFQHNVELGENYNNLSWLVGIEYPEYLDMTDNDLRRYFNLTRDTMPETPEINTHLSVTRKKGKLTVSFVPIVFKDGRFKKLVSFKLNIQLIKSNLAKTRVGEEEKRYADNSVLANGSWAKIRVAQTGIHELTEATIRKAGFTDLSKVRIYGYGGALQPERLTLSYMQSTDDLQEVPSVYVGGRRLFYAKGPVTMGSGTRTRNPYSNYGYYFITQGDTEPLTVDEQTFKASFYPSEEFRNTLYEVDDYAWYAGGRNLYDSQAFGTGVSHDYKLSSHPTCTSGKVTVAVTADRQLSVAVSVNGNDVGSFNTSNIGQYDKAKVTTKSFIATLQAENTVTIKQNGEGEMKLDYIIVTNDSISPAPDLAATQFPTAEYVYRITNQNLHAHKAVDMTIVIPTSQKWLQEAERLKTLHETRDGMTVRIVPLDEIENEFSSGTPDATAIRRYMKMMYDRAQGEDDMPKYLLLFGDAAWDNRMNSQDWKRFDQMDFITCFESENSLSSTESFVTDDFLVMLDDGEQLVTSGQYSGTPDVAVGRLPARTLDQAKTLVDKIESYLSDDVTGDWRNTVVFMGDDGNANIHMADADEAAEEVRKLAPSIDVKKVMWDAYQLESGATGNTYPDVTRQIKQYMQSGALIMDYCGHGRADCISHEMVLSLNDFCSIRTKKMPLWITASCDIMPFDGQEDNIGETSMLYADGGAIAFFGTSRTVYADRNKTMNMALLKYLFTKDANGKYPTVGEASRKAKEELATKVQGAVEGKFEDLTINKLQYSLLGDPAVRLHIPDMTVSIDSINGMPVQKDGLVVMAAGEKVKVTGHVEGSEGLANDFNGVVTANIKGTQEKIVCRLNNDPDADAPFEYYDRTSTIYRGSDSIRAGRFCVEFIVPRDIKYSDSPGQILLYANDNLGRQANGNSYNIAFNGTKEEMADSIGPSIFCYLNSKSFTNGERVHPTPFFMAEINDESGINATGTGIGHDMQVVVDNQMAKTYVVNDYFTFDFGSFTSGTVGYQLPELDEGKHTLTFRAWDIYNNSSSATIDFYVDPKAAPKVFDVECTANPASTSTTFRVLHDRVGSDMDVTVEIYDISGRKLAAVRQQDTPVTNIMTIDWDLTTPGGSRIGNGVYLYRVKMNTSNGEIATKAKKLIILSNK